MTTPSTADQGPANAGGPNQTAAALTALGQVFDPSLISSTVGQVFNAAAAGFLGQGISPAIQPPVLKTFVYSPEVRVIIAHGAAQVDVSADLVRCTLIRPENSAATFAMTLQNKDMRYTRNNKPTFSRMDRIMVYMKKTGWTQVFSGYLDTVPYRQLYPGTVDLKATCTIKRLMNTWFNPDLPESQDLMNQYTTIEAETGQGADSGLGSLLTRVLRYAGGWDPSNIHIQNFPMSFFNFLTTSIQSAQQANLPAQQALQHLLLGSDTTPGPGAYAGHNSDAGVPGPSTPGVGGVPGASAGVADTLTMFYVSQIVAACDEKGMGPLVSDNNLSAGLAQAGATGAASGGPMQNPGQQKAWQQVQQTNLDNQQANRNSDAAILGTAAAMALTGAGTGIRNLCNVAVPGSDQYANDGPGLSGSTGVGILALVNSSEWGSLDQRMNPKQAAGMFMAHVASLTGGNWRNMNPADACSQALRTSSSSMFAATVSQATTIVQAYRTATTGTASTTATGSNSTIATGSSATNVASTLAGGSPGTNPNLVVGAASTAPNPVINPGATSPTRAGKPVPDSEGAINWAMTQLGKPYEWGGHGPATYDCSGLVSAAFKSIGVAVPAQTDSIRGAIPQVTPNSAVQRGDLVEPSTGHVVLWCGDGTIIEAQKTGTPVHRVTSWIGDPSTWAYVGRACLNGGIDPSAPYNPPETMGPGNPPGALDQLGGNGVGSGGASEDIARNMFSYWFTNAFASSKAALFSGRKAFIDGAPLIQMVQSIASAGLRSWSSAPNGDFMAWYPDYFGLDGKPCVLRLEDIELTDVNIQFSDDALTTHVYVAGDETFGAPGALDPVAQWVDSQGFVTVEDADTWLYQRLIQIAPPDENLSGDLLLRRYGVRPLKKEFLMAGDHNLERLLAIQTFMEKWAQQYQTDISMTFMPELFPGMRVELGGDHNLQVYVSSVTHNCDYEQGFYTTATILAPSVPMAKKGMAALQTVIGPSLQDLAFAGPSNFGGNADPQSGQDT